MSETLTLSYAGPYTVEVDPAAGRALRFGDGGYPLFKAPDAREVAAPDDCLAFLRELHLSLCPVFDRRLRRWVERYFDAIVALADANREVLTPPAGMEGDANAHRVWCLAALRPLVLGRVELPAGPVAAPVLLWTGSGPVAVRFEAGGAAPEGVAVRVFPPAVLDGGEAEFAAALGPGVADYWEGVAVPRHPFARGPLSGLGAGLSGVRAR